MFNNFFGFVGGNNNNKNGEVPDASVLEAWNEYAAQSSSSNYDIESQQKENSTLLNSSKDTFSNAKIKDSFKSSFNIIKSKITSVTDSAQNAVNTVPTKKQWYYFAAFLIGGLVMLFLAFTIALPLIVISPSKFAFSFSFGSLLIMLALTSLKGIKEQLKHMLSRERAIFSVGYVGSILGTLYAALIIKSYLLSIFFCGIQMLALMYYVVSYFPGGTDGAKFILGMAYQTFISFIKMIFRF